MKGANRKNQIQDTNSSQDGTRVLADPKKNKKLLKYVNKVDQLMKSTDFGDYDDLVSYETGTPIHKGQSYGTSGHLMGRVPTRAYAKRKEDETISLYKELQDAAPGVFEGLNPTEFTGYVKSRQDETEALDFERFLLGSIAPDDPYQMHQLQELFPEVSDRRCETIDRNKDKYMQLIKLWIYGCETDEDYALTYKLSEGLETFDPEVLARLIGFDEASISAAQDRAQDGFSDNKRVNRAEESIDVNNHIDIRNPMTYDGSTLKINRISGVNYKQGNSMMSNFY